MKPSQPWIPLEKIQETLQLEPVLVMLACSVGAWIFYQIFLRSISAARHKNLRGLFKNLLFHLFIFGILYGSYWGLDQLEEPPPPLLRLTSYTGLAALLSGAVVFVKISRILAFEYLFLRHLRVAVPLLLVNLFTLILSIIIAAWMATEIFGVKLTPLLATSAILSLVLGLALQDTLGNLFAGVALQFDKPYEIGDWIEVQNNSQKWVGQVHEISWRATVLMGFTDEFITISNRVMGQSEISNFSAKQRPFIRSQLFRLPYGVPTTEVKKILILSALSTPGVKKEPMPTAFLAEANESWMLFKLFYSIEDYSKQLSIGDLVLTTALEALAKEKIEISAPRISVEYAKT